MPLVPLTWALRASGHEVLLAATANMADVVTDAGLPFAEVAGPVQMPEVLSVDRHGDPVTMPKGEEALLRHFGRGYARLALRMIDGLTEIAETWRPDLIVSETYCFAGPLLAAMRGLPWVRHDIRLVSPADITAAGAQELEPELRRLGRDTFPAPVRILDLCPPNMRPAESERVIKMRAVPYNGRSTRLKEWAYTNRDRPLVCLTFGTRVPLPNKGTIPGGFRLLQGLMDTLPQHGFDVVVAVSDALAEQLRPLPHGVVAAGQIALSSVLPECDLVVHHGGYGTTMTELTLGVPQVIVPVIPEVWESTRLMSAAGVAVEVPWSAATADTVADTCTLVVTSETFSKNARTVRAEIAALATPADVVRELESL
ncbi:nucleotide disphospho-sugar-binding domain-containing protein [Actinoplanes sp. NPDC026619]|uniref:nucleotide disphospho-sugar-binding domain-containing protein n=1 Tax=Actinoplanes sp. NPDC026619 TaxID=3155798 RepID=UPI0033D58688